MAVVGGFRSDLSKTRKTDGNFGNVSVCVLFSKVAYQPFSSPEAAILLVSTENHDLWPTSGLVQLRKSAIHGLPVTLRML